MPRPGEEERVCPHCGTDRWRAERDMTRVQTRLRSLERGRERLAASLGVAQSNTTLAKHEGKEVRDAMQRKIQRQAAAIRRLEKKLLKRGELPHDDARPYDALPVSDIPEVADA
jgi:seryl-tRNA synthetase